MALDRLLAMTVFVKVVEQGSFARASERLHMSTSAVSRHVAELELQDEPRILSVSPAACFRARGKPIEGPND